MITHYPSRYLMKRECNVSINSVPCNVTCSTELTSSSLTLQYLKLISSFELFYSLEKRKIGKQTPKMIKKGVLRGSKSPPQAGKNRVFYVFFDVSSDNTPLVSRLSITRGGIIARKHQKNQKKLIFFRLRRAFRTPQDTFFDHFRSLFSYFSLL